MGEIIGTPYWFKRLKELNHLHDMAQKSLAKKKSKKFPIPKYKIILDPWERMHLLALMRVQRSTWYPERLNTPYPFMDLLDRLDEAEVMQPKSRKRKSSKG